MTWPLSLALAAALAASSSAPRIVELREIPLRSGVNRVPRLAPDGRDGLIVQATPHVETADQTHTDFMVLIAPARRGDPWAPARVDQFDAPERAEAEPSDMVSDYPRTGEDALSSVRFARARVGGAPAVLLIRARRDFVLPIPTPSPVTIDMFRLVVEPEFGEERFVRISRRRYPGCFGDTDSALKVLLGLPLPAGAAGASTAVSCAPANR